MKKNELEKLRNLVEKSEYFLLKNKEGNFYDQRANARSKIVKKVLASIYGFKQVRVKRGTGTASGWIYVDITVETSKRNFPRELKDRYKIEKMLEKIGIEFPQYFPDAGPGDCWTNCLIINLEIH